LAASGCRAARQGYPGAVLSAVNESNEGADSNMAITLEQQELGQFIPLHYHYNMLLDQARMKGFKAALDYAVQPGAKVLELGGGTGVLSSFAAAKASKVWCVERNPELAREARRMLALNGLQDRVEVVQADAFEYLPPEPVDVVICEMIHVAMLREKQVQVIESFKQRYRARFGPRLPRFVPEAFIQAAQPVQQDFVFEGYYAPTYLFQDPVARQDRTVELADPAVYQTCAYEEAVPPVCQWHGEIAIGRDGELNALRFITKNVLAVVVEQGDTIDWFSQYLIVPLENPLRVRTGDRVRVQFVYPVGAGLDVLRPQVSL
jgi:protein arginine N-methyltransferase 1